MQAPILLYHALDSAEEPAAVDNPADLSVVVPADEFRRQLRCLEELGKTVVPLEDLLDPKVRLPGDDHVVLTFDDGRRSDWSLACPALVEAGATATFYVVAGFVDNDPGYLTSAQLREMSSQGMLIGSHGMTHRFLSELDRRAVRRELSDSRARLEDLLGRAVLHFALPGGHHSQMVLDEAGRCGYRSVATCKIGLHRRGGNPLRLPRLEIRRGLSTAAFRKTFGRAKILQLQMLESAKTGLRLTCGLSRYERLRQIAHRYLALKR